MSTTFICRSPPPLGSASTVCTSAAVMSVATLGGCAPCVWMATDDSVSSAPAVPHTMRFMRSLPGEPEGSPLLTHPLLQAPARRTLIAVAGEAGEHVALVVCAHPFGPRALRVGTQRAVLGAADANAVAPAGIADLVAAAFGRFGRAADELTAFGIGDDQRVVAQDGDAARPPELPPLVHELHVAIEDLHAVVGAIGD